MGFGSFAVLGCKDLWNNANNLAKWYGHVMRCLELCFAMRFHENNCTPYNVCQPIRFKHSMALQYIYIYIYIVPPGFRRTFFWFLRPKMTDFSAAFLQICSISYCFAVKIYHGQHSSYIVTQNTKSLLSLFFIKFNTYLLKKSIIIFKKKNYWTLKFWTEVYIVTKIYILKQCYSLKLFIHKTILKTKKYHRFQKINKIIQ